MVNIAVIGIGMMGQTHANAIRGMGAQMKLAAICGADIEQDRQKASGYGCPYYTDLEEMLQKEAIDAVDICTPTFAHEEAIVKAAQAGKHILCEKPFCLTGDKAGELVGLCEEKRVKLMVAQVIRFKPEYILLAEQIKNGALGEVRTGFFRRMTSCAGRVKRNVKWYDDPSRSGGALFDLMIHDLDFVYSVLGKPQEVYAVGRKSPSGCWDEVEVSLSFAAGARIVIEASSFMPEKYPFTVAFRVNGENGCIEYRAGSAVNAGSSMDDSVFTFYPKQGDAKELTVESGDDYAAEIAYFCDCVERGVEPEKVPARQSAEVIRIVMAVLASLEEHKKIIIEEEKNEH